MADANWLRLVDQDQFWVTREGERVALGLMTSGHRRNLLRLLHRNRVGLAWRYDLALLYLLPGDDDDLGFDVATGDDPDDWFFQRPLVRRLILLELADWLSTHIRSDLAVGAPPYAETAGDTARAAAHTSVDVLARQGLADQLVAYGWQLIVEATH